MDDFITLDEIKQNPSNKKNLQESIDELNSNITMLVSIFKEANQNMKTDDNDATVLAAKLDPLFEKLTQITEQNKKMDVLLDQNRKIAEGLIAIAELIRKDLPKIIARPESRPIPQFNPMSQPMQQMPQMQSMQMQQQPRMMPMPQMNQGMPQTQQGLPPLPPPPAPKKKGLF